MVCLDNTETEGIQEIRLKTDQLNAVMMAYLRLVVRLKPSKQLDLLHHINKGEDADFLHVEAAEGKSSALRSLMVEYDTLGLYK